MAYTKYSLTPADNNAAPPNGAPEGMLPSAVNDTMRDMMSQIRDVGDGIRGGTYTMTAPVITGGSITGVALSGNTLTNPVITGGSINNTTVGATTRSTGAFTTLASNGATTFTAGTASTSTTTGTAVITGGLGVSGRINAANFDGIVGANTAATGNFTTLGASSTATLNTLVSSGATLTGGSINGMAIGATTRAAGSFTTVTTTNDASISGLTVGKGGGAVAGNNSLGTSALAANTTGSLNTAVGWQAASSNTTGGNITATGFQALFTNTTGSSNTAIGMQTLYSNTTASNNTAVGYQAGYSNTTGAQNSYFGQGAGYAQTTGAFNTFIGRNAGTAATTGNQNTFIGDIAGQAVTTGGGNSIIGRFSGNQGGLDIRTASNYIVLSDGDGNPRGYFDNNGVFIVGTTSATPAGAGDTKGISLWTNGSSSQIFSTGNGDTAAVFNRAGSDGALIRTRRQGADVGSISVTGSATAYNTSSDYRLKENIAPMTGALATVAQLKPVTYNWKVDGSSGQGFIAHELQAIVPDCVQGEKDAVDADGKPVYQGIDTSFLVATLTAAIQELKAEFDAYKATHP